MTLLYELQTNNVTKTYGAVRLHQPPVPREALRRRRDMFRLASTTLHFGTKVAKTKTLHVPCVCIALTER